MCDAKLCEMPLNRVSDMQFHFLGQAKVLFFGQAA